MNAPNTAKITGYAHPLYARSSAEFGTPLELSRCGGWILKRKIHGWSNCDAMGCYPLFACQDWTGLEADLEAIGSELVSLALVADPFGCNDPEYLKRCFPDVVIPFKEHFVINLRYSLDKFVSKHHCHNARKALEKARVEVCIDPRQFSDEWLELYAQLIARHQITGISAFSRKALSEQLHVPGLIAFRAEQGGTPVGMNLWYVQGEVGYYHLGAYSAKGYELKASFALFWRAIEYFAATGLHWLNLGAGVGIKPDRDSGLNRFKRGWATGSRTAYFCGRIFDRAKYWEITRAVDRMTTDYFPAYRHIEFSQPIAESTR
jgi:hypothetical protein